MELSVRVKHFWDLIKKHRFVFLVILIGIFLLMIPTPKGTENIEQPHLSTTDTTEQSLEERLSAVLCMVEGAGEVRVIISVAAGEEVVYQTNSSQTTSDNSESIKCDTVMVTSADRSTTGLVKQIIPEVLKGAVVLCNGADDPVVRLSVVDAVSKLTGLGANQISVLKMK